MDSSAYSSAASCVFEKETGSARRLGDGLSGAGSADSGGLHSRLRWWRVHYHNTTPSDTSGGEFGLNRHHDPVITSKEAQHRNGMADSSFRFCVGDRAGVQRIRLCDLRNKLW